MIGDKHVAGSEVRIENRSHRRRLCIGKGQLQHFPTEIEHPRHRHRHTRLIQFGHGGLQAGFETDLVCYHPDNEHARNS